MSSGTGTRAGAGAGVGFGEKIFRAGAAPKQAGSETLICGTVV